MRRCGPVARWPLCLSTLSAGVERAKPWEAQLVAGEFTEERRGQRRQSLPVAATHPGLSFSIWSHPTSWQGEPRLSYYPHTGQNPLEMSLPLPTMDTSLHSQTMPVYARMCLHFTGPSAAVLLGKALCTLPTKITAWSHLTSR